MKILFFGTPQVAVPFLDWCHKHHTVVGVVSRPDEPVGRGYKVTAPPTKVFAETAGLPVFQPEGKWTEDKVAPLKQAGADIGIAVAYGRLMPEPVFNAARLGSVNVHFSLLPKYRGAGPMQWSLINGDSESGVTLFWIEEGLDSGPIFYQKGIPIAPDDNASTLREKLTTLGIDLLSQTMADVEKNVIRKEPQQGEPTLAPQLKKEDGHINWTKPAASIAHLVAGVYEWPVAFTGTTASDGTKKKIKIYEAVPEPSAKKGQPGEIIEVRKNQGIVVGTGEGQLLLKSIQPEGKKRMPAWSYWQGARLKIGDRFE